MPFPTYIQKITEALKNEAFEEARSLFEEVSALELTLEEIQELQALHEQMKAHWNKEDLSLDLSWVMARQELENPQLRRTHETLSAEGREATHLIQKMLKTLDDNEEENLVEQIRETGEKAIYPLIEALLSFKKVRKQIMKSFKIEKKE